MTAIPVAAKRVGCLWNIFHDHLRIPATFTSLDMARNTPTSPLPPAIGVRVCQRVSVPCCSREFGLWRVKLFCFFFFSFLFLLFFFLFLAFFLIPCGFMAAQLATFFAAISFIFHHTKKIKQRWAA